MINPSKSNQSILNSNNQQQIFDLVSVATFHQIVIDCSVDETYNKMIWRLKW